jgi:RES domain-containing protein
MSSTVSRSRSTAFAWRIGSPAHPLLDGGGAAARDDARWNSRGRHVIYAAEHYATALLEKAAQLNSVRIPRNLVYVRIALPTGTSVEEAAPDDVPGWDADDKRISQQFGDRWYDEGRSLALYVPSLAAPGLERTVIINARHADFGKIAATPPERVRCHPRLLA